MGIPGLFSNLVRKHNAKDSETSIIKQTIYNNEINESVVDIDNDNNDDNNNNCNTNKNNLNIDYEDIHLYLDFNGAMYQVIKPEIKTDETLIIYILEYLDNLIKIFNIEKEDGTIINKVTQLYIAIDGVPPRAKMVQQRDRRFHSICRKNKSNKINEQYGNGKDKTTVNNNIDTNMITPGTVFMDKISKAINEHLKTKENYKDINVFFNDWSVPGEGEHKILQHLRKFPSPENTKTVIYGLDGDLIMLSLASRIQNLYLVREAYEYGQYAIYHEGYPYLFMDMNSLKRAIVEEFCVKMTTPYSYITPKEISRFIDDYIIITMVLGNDFVPKTPWYGLSNNGYNTLLSAYFEVHNGTECSLNDELRWLVNRDEGKINIHMLCDIFSILNQKEDEVVTKFLEKRQKKRIPIPRDCTERERRQTLVDYLPLQFLHIEKEIKPREKNWRQRFYSICHQMNNSEDNINKLCEYYIKTLVWNMKYYLDDCPSWDWYYPYHYAPTFHDIYLYLKEFKSLTHIKFNKGKPITPQTLLFMVLPPPSSRLMARNIQRTIFENKSLNKIYFPKTYSINFPLHSRYYECTPNIPKMETKYAISIVNGCKLSQSEIERNKEGTIKYYESGSMKCVDVKYN